MAALIMHKYASSYNCQYIAEGVHNLFNQVCGISVGRGPETCIYTVTIWHISRDNLVILAVSPSFIKLPVLFPYFQPRLRILKSREIILVSYKFLRATQFLAVTGNYTCIWRMFLLQLYLPLTKVFAVTSLVFDKCLGWMNTTTVPPFLLPRSVPAQNWGRV